MPFHQSALASASTLSRRYYYDDYQLEALDPFLVRWQLSLRYDDCATDFTVNTFSPFSLNKIQVPP